MARKNLGTFLATALVAGTLASHASADDSHVVVTIDDLRNARGVVRCVLFDRADGWPEVHTKALRVLTVPIVEGRRATCDFASLAPGNYAFAYMHDENENKKLDKNIIGVPIEGYGVSNDVRGTVSAPSFASARFKFDGGTLRIHPKTTY
jgi:uncharacterized protein (DUF2141 family)